MSRREAFPKPTAPYRVLNFFGDNVVTSEGEMWAAHRKTAQPAFQEKIIVYVWEQASRIMGELLEDWSTKSDIRYNHTTDLTKEVRLLLS